MNQRQQQQHRIDRLGLPEAVQQQQHQHTVSRLRPKMDRFERAAEESLCAPTAAAGRCSETRLIISNRVRRNCHHRALLPFPSPLLLLGPAIASAAEAAAALLLRPPFRPFACPNVAFSGAFVVAVASVAIVRAQVSSGGFTATVCTSSQTSRTTKGVRVNRSSQVSKLVID